MVSRILFQCLIFNYYNISICKKEKLKDDTSKKFVKPMEVNRACISFTNFLYDVSSLIFTTSAFVKKKRSKMRHLKKFVKPMEVKLRSKMSPWPKILHRYDINPKKIIDETYRSAGKNWAMPPEDSSASRLTGNWVFWTPHR